MKTSMRSSIGRLAFEKKAFPLDQVTYESLQQLLRICSIKNFLTAVCFLLSNFTVISNGKCYCLL